MSVFFCYRRHNLGPSGKYLKRFDDATVFDWFVRRWQGILAPETEDWYEEMFGCPPVYGFGSLFRAIAEHSLPVPGTPEELAACLRRYLYVEGEVERNLLLDLPHLMQVLTDDDELELAYYFFDDAYLAAHGGLAAFLLHDDWRLPADMKEGDSPPLEGVTVLEGGRGPGAVYFAEVGFVQGCNLSEPIPRRPLRIDGVRLPSLARFLATDGVTLGESIPLWLLRSNLVNGAGVEADLERAFLQGIRTGAGDDLTWAVYADWLAEQPARQRLSLGPYLLERAMRRITRSAPEFHRHITTSAHWLWVEEFAEADSTLKYFEENEAKKLWRQGPSSSLLQVDEHCAVLCLHVGQCFWTARDSFQQWFLFDDLWVHAHPELAAAIIRYASRWDVLTP